MLRTIIVRNELIRKTIRQAIRTNLTRTLSTQCVKRKNRYNQSLLVCNQNAPWQYNIIRFYADLPKHIKVPLPALSPTMETGNLMSWAKKEGDKLNEGDLLCEIETDKATMGFETPEEGYLAKIIVPGGTKGVKIGQLVCIIVDNEADVAAFKEFKADAAAAAPTATPTSKPTPSPSTPAPAAVPPPSNLPKHIIVPLPALSPTMESGNLQSWSKKEGDKLNEGDLLCEIETDKATMGFETPEEGYLAKIVVPAGTKGVKLGEVVAIIVEKESDIAAFKDYKPGAAPSAPSAPTTSAPTAATHVSTATSAPKPTAPSAPGERVYASPLARKLAREKGIQLTGKGTGVYDSITSKDLAGMKAGVAPIAADTVGGRKSMMAEGLAAARARRTGEAPPAAAAAAAAAPSRSKPGMPTTSAYTDIPITNIRAIIAKRLLESKLTIPHYYLFQTCNADNLIKTRAKFNAQLEKEGIRLSINDFIMKATACASMKVPDVNAYWMDNVIRQYHDVDISLAVSTPTGLITPIIFGANKKGLVQISQETKELAKKARQNKLQPHEFQGGTITVSNLGMFGTSYFNAIINPPQSAILAIGSNESRLVADASCTNGFRSAEFITVSFSCDHRLIDGALGAQWLKAFRDYIEHPETMIL